MKKKQGSPGSPVCGTIREFAWRSRGKVKDSSVIAQVVCRRSLAVEAQIRCQASPYGIFSAKSGTQMGFPPGTW